jgi:protein-disulfide isomerase
MRALSLVPVLLSLASVAAAQTPTCEALDAAQKASARELFARLHPYDCCDDTLAACLEQQPRCPLVERLASDVCRQVKLGRAAREIERALDRRAQSMVDAGRRASFALDAAMAAGEEGAPVELVVYACVRCPFCKVLVPALHTAVTEGALKGKVRLWFRPYPLKNHEGSTEGALGVLAAARMGGFWPYLLKVYAGFDEFSPERLGPWAEAAGMERAGFEAALADGETRAALVESKKEGLRNRVTATPALFVNGRQYVYELDLEVLGDVLEEEFARVSEAG